MAESGQTSKSLVYSDHRCSLAVGQDGMTYGCLASVSKYRHHFGRRQGKWRRLWVPAHLSVGSAVGRGPRKDVRWLKSKVRWGQISGSDLGAEREDREAKKPSFSPSSSTDRYSQAPSQVFCLSDSLETV